MKKLHFGTKIERATSKKDALLGPVVAKRSLHLAKWVFVQKGKSGPYDLYRCDRCGTMDYKLYPTAERH